MVILFYSLVHNRDLDNLNSDKDYYNDLPGKLPPELTESKKSVATSSASTASHKKVNLFG